MKISFLLLAQLFSSAILAQSNQATVFIRHDTTTLKTDKAIIKSILQAVERGKLRALDCFTNLRIPAGQVYTWRMQTDTIPQYDGGGNYARPAVVQHYRKAEAITQIRVQQDWYLNRAASQIISRVRWIELLEEIKNSTGEFIGLRPFCRVNY